MSMGFACGRFGRWLAVAAVVAGSAGDQTPRSGLGSGIERQCARRRRHQVPNEAEQGRARRARRAARAGQGRAAGRSRPVQPEGDGGIWPVGGRLGGGPDGEVAGRVEL